jgi:glutathione synthase/RimK-type ligase-like ATP-grasp enzyme
MIKSTALFLRKGLKRLILTFHSHHINWLDFIRYKKNNSEIVVYVSPKNFIDGVIRTTAIWKFGFVKALIRRKKNFVIATDLGGLFNKKIFWYVTKYLDKHNFSNYSATIVGVAKQLESQGNVLYPNSYELSFLENKKFMYEKFKEHGVRHPKTLILKDIDDIQSFNIAYPVLIKELHSAGSLGVHKVANGVELRSLVDSEEFKKNNRSIIIQSLLNMRKDLRVVVIGGEVVLSYWRVNNASEWRPTATKFGSTVVFGDFPEKWRSYIIEALKKLNMRMGAFDVAWEDDDLDTEPYFLEVSPEYFPNAPYDEKKYNFDYSKYRNQISLISSPEKDTVDIVRKCAKKYVDYILE